MADADADADLLATGRVPEPFGHLRHIRGLVGRHDHGELVTADPEEGVGSHRGLEASGHGPQDLVAHGVTVTVVDPLEVVDVEQHDPQARGRRRPHGGEGVVEGRSVLQPRDGISPGPEPQLVEGVGHPKRRGDMCGVDLEDLDHRRVGPHGGGVGEEQQVTGMAAPQRDGDPGAQAGVRQTGVVPVGGGRAVGVDAHRATGPAGDHVQLGVLQVVEDGRCRSPAGGPDPTAFHPTDQGRARAGESGCPLGRKVQDLARVACRREVGGLACQGLPGRVLAGTADGLDGRLEVRNDGHEVDEVVVEQPDAGLDVEHAHHSAAIPDGNADLRAGGAAHRGVHVGGDVTDEGDLPAGEGGAEDPDLGWDAVVDPIEATLGEAPQSLGSLDVHACPREAGIDDPVDGVAGDGLDGDGDRKRRRKGMGHGASIRPIGASVSNLRSSGSRPPRVPGTASVWLQDGWRLLR